MGWNIKSDMRSQAKQSLRVSNVETRKHLLGFTGVNFSLFNGVWD